MLPHSFFRSQQKETGISGHYSNDPFQNDYSRMSRHALRVPKRTHFLSLAIKEPVITISDVGVCTNRQIWLDESHLVFIYLHSFPEKGYYVNFVKTTKASDLELGRGRCLISRERLYFSFCLITGEEQHFQETIPSKTRHLK